MSSGFHTDEESMIVSNRRFESLVKFALDIATEIASTQQEHSFVDQLRSKYHQAMYPGYDMLIDEEFSSQEERIFWSRVYEKLSHKVLARKVANPDVLEEIRLSLAYDAKRLSRMLRT